MTDYINGLFRAYDDKPEKMQEMWKAMNVDGEKPEDALEMFFVNNITSATLRSYYTSELVGENTKVMRYDRHRIFCTPLWRDESDEKIHTGLVNKYIVESFWLHLDRSQSLG